MTSASNGRAGTEEDMSESGMDFIGFGSDIEEPTMQSARSAQESRDYWMGKKCFGYLIAKSSLSDHRAADTMEHLDVLYEERLQTFPYSRCVRMITADTVGGADAVLSEETPYRSLLLLIGANLRRDSDGGSGAIASAVERCLEPVGLRSISASPMSARAERTTNHTFSNGSARQDIDGAFIYNNALHAHCERDGEMMSWDEKRLRLHPPSFQARVNVQGLWFEGIGSSKKMARHRACREACIAMNIEH